MNFFITGAGGFIGRHLVHRLIRDQHNVIACTRRNTELLAGHNLRIVPLEFRQMTRPQDWESLLQNVDFVINCAGIISPTRTQTFEDVHTRAPIALFKAAADCGVRKLIQISAMGSDEYAQSAYHQSKKQADDALAAMPIHSAILRPSIVYGEGAASMAFFHALAALPVRLLIDQGRQRIQPVHIDDLIDIILRCVATEDRSQCVDIVGASSVSMKELLNALSTRLGKPAALEFSIPADTAIRLAAIVQNPALPMVSADNVRMLLRGNCTSDEATTAVLGRAPADIHDKLLDLRADQARRWHARMYFLRPLLRGSIGLVWLWSGITSACFFPAESSLELLAPLGIAGIPAVFTLYGLSALDILIGGLTLAGCNPHRLLSLQILIILGYSIVLTLWLPAYLVHPFGPVVKNLPMLAAIVVLKILEEEKP